MSQHAGVPGGHSVWFSWKASASGDAFFGIGRGQVEDTVLAAYKGSAVNALTKVADNDDQDPEVRTIAISFAAVKDTTYRNALDGKRSDDLLGSMSPDQGAFDLASKLTPVAGPSLSIADVSMTEGDSGQKQANLVLKLSKAASTDVTVAATTVEGTAKKTTDFVTRSASVVIPQGAPAPASRCRSSVTRSRNRRKSSACPSA